MPQCSSTLATYSVWLSWRLSIAHEVSQDCEDHPHKKKLKWITSFLWSILSSTCHEWMNECNELCHNSTVAAYFCLKICILRKQNIGFCLSYVLSGFWIHFKSYTSAVTKNGTMLILHHVTVLLIFRHDTLCNSSKKHCCWPLCFIPHLAVDWPAQFGIKGNECESMHATMYACVCVWWNACIYMPLWGAINNHISDFHIPQKHSPCSSYVCMVSND